MEKSIVVSKLARKQNGAFFKVRYYSELPVKAASKREGVTAIKVTEMVCRKGIAYSHQKAVQQKVAEGKVLTHELSYGVWDPEYPGLVINHKGHDYIRVYAAPNPKRTIYYLNGKECSKEDLRMSGHIQNSWFNKASNEKPDAMNIRTDHILEICEKK